MSERFTVYLDDIAERLSYHLYAQKPILPDDHIDSVISSIGNCMVANGCFDGCHPGHLTLIASLDTLAYARKLRPIVAMNSDESIRRLKGPGRPIMPQIARCSLINNLKWPMTVVIFDEDTPQRLMDILRPKVVLKGSEYAPESVIRWRDSEVLTVPMLPNWSTTKILGDSR